MHRGRSSLSAWVQVVVVSVAAFASTNLDGFWLLLGLYAEAKRSAAYRVAAGYSGATIGVALLAWGASSVLEWMPTH